MKQDDRITIVHGPNGFGKTTVLRLVNALFDSRYSQFRATEFKLFAIDFTDGTRVEVSREFASSKKRSPTRTAVRIKLLRAGQTANSTLLEPLSPEDLEVPASLFERSIPGLVREDRDLWRLIESNEELSFEDVVERFSDSLPVGRSRQRRNEEWLTELARASRVKLVDSQRLFRVGRIRNRDYPGPQTDPVTPSVSHYSSLLAKSIQAKVAEYAKLSQSLDRSFPVRLVAEMQSQPSTASSSDQLRVRLADLEAKRTRFRSVGLLDEGDATEFQVPADLQESTQRVLLVNVSDVETKLGVFDAIAGKIELLQKIINARFSYKLMSVNKDRGVVFQTTTGTAPLSLTQLSSGEQQMLVMFAELLFGLEPNTLVMIDEPELSLHVAWQMEFLHDLQQVTRLVDVDVLIATHSPQIIHDRWDLTVELGAG